MSNITLLKNNNQLEDSMLRSTIAKSKNSRPKNKMCH